MVAAPFLLDSLSAGAGFVFYLSANLLESLRNDRESGRSERRRMMNKNKKRSTEPRTILNAFHLLGTLALFGLGLAHAVLLAKSRDDTLELKADPDVASVLFGSLLWLIMFLGLIEASAGANYVLYVPWMLVLVSYAISTAVSSASYYSSVPDIAVQWTRLSLLLSLVLSVAMRRRKKIALSDTEDQAAEGAQPLIVTEEAETNKTQDEADDEDFDEDDDKSVKSSASDRDDKADEDMTDAQKDERKQHQALRDRPWYQYVASFRVFLPFVRPRDSLQWFYLAVLIINVAMVRVITIGQPLMLGAVIDDLTYRRFSFWKILAYVGLRFASSSSGTQLIKNIVFHRLNIELHNNLTTHCFNHIMDLDATFHMSKSTPAVWQIMDRGQSVVNLMQDIVFDHLPVIADLIIGLFIVSRLFGAYLCFIVATTMVLLSWSNRITMTKKTRMRRYYVDLWRNWYTHMSESFMHWRTVSEFNKIRHEKERHYTKTKAYAKVSVQQRSFSLCLAGLQEIVVTVGFLFVCIIAAKEIANGHLDVSRFVVLITYWGQIMSPVTRIAGFASDIAEQLVDAEKLMLLLEKKSKITTKPDSPLFVFKGGKVEFEKCSFSYDNARTVTKEVSFSAEPGQTVALVGETGGGKSTIFNLLYRFYDPAEGRIIVDGQDISQVNLESYRAVLGLVPQDPILFNTSILKNVRYSNQAATKSEVIQACKASQFHEKVEKFPKKYLQKVGELAQKLSGGERQRLAIARAILKTPGILLLDEATSAVDSVTETKIQESLDKLAEGRTTFIIAHRLSTILGADKILVIKAGEIVESGTHEQLLYHGNGAYKELWDAQQKLATGKSKENKDQKESEDNLMTFEENSDSDGHGDKEEDSDDTKGGDASGDDIEDKRKSPQQQPDSLGTLTPSISSDPTPKSGSILGHDQSTNKTFDEEGQQNDEVRDQNDHENETSSIASKKTDESN